MLSNKIISGSILTIFLVALVIAGHNINPQSYSVNQNISVLYNISVNNTDTSALANITGVTIVLPNNFTFVNASNGTDSIGSMNELTWSALNMIPNLTTKYFWFNATASYPGIYNIIVISSNSTANINNSVVVTVNDTASPIITPVVLRNNSNISGNYILNVTLNDYSSIASVSFNISNSTGNITALKYAGNTSLSSWNSTWNTSALTDGTVYNITIIANDSLGYRSNLTLLNVKIDNSIPSVPQIIDKATTNTSVKFNITVNDTVSGINYCSVKRNSSAGSYSDRGNAENISSSTWSFSDSASCEKTYTYNVTCFDYAGNYNINTSDFTTEACVTGDSSGGGTGDTSSWTWSTTSYTDEEFSYKLSINKNMSEKDRISIKFNGETHYVGVMDIQTDRVIINVSSTSQQATINSGESHDFNIDGDNYYDLRVRVNGLNSTKVNLTINYIHELVTPETFSALGSDSGSGSDGGSGTNNNTGSSSGSGTSSSPAGWIIIVIIIIIIIIIGILIVWFSTNKGSNPFKFGKDKYVQL